MRYSQLSHEIIAKFAVISTISRFDPAPKWIHTTICTYLPTYLLTYWWSRIMIHIDPLQLLTTGMNADIMGVHSNPHPWSIPCVSDMTLRSVRSTNLIVCRVVLFLYQNASLRVATVVRQHRIPERTDQQTLKITSFHSFSEFLGFTGKWLLWSAQHL